ncbi:MAG: hypothetical protein IKC04_07530 [Oscillospiraceae bacterium]|nr:hypothetical protein [Oscillospiraceae bacterium]
MERIKIGWAKREISMEGPLQIPGQTYLRISEGIHDPLYATALCLDGGAGQDAAILVTTDVTVLRAGVVDMVMKKVAERDPSIPLDAIVIGATHTHEAGPMNEVDNPVSADGQEYFDGKTYKPFFAERTAEAIVEAWNTRKPGGFAYGYGYAVVAHQRRAVYFEDMSKVRPNAVAPNGHGVMYGKTNDPLFSHYESGADHFLNALFTFDENDKLTGMIVNVPCPSQTSEHLTKLSADFWCEVRAGVKKEYGEDVFVLPQCAAAGDLAPRILHYLNAQQRRMRLKYGIEYDQENAKRGTEDQKNKAFAERRDIAERILDGVRDVYGWAKKEIYREVPLRHIVRTLQLPKRMITDEEAQWCRDTIKQMEDLVPEAGKATADEIRFAASRAAAVRGRNERALKKYEDQKNAPTLPSRVHTIRLGDIAFATNRFELYIDYQHRIQARSPFLQTFIVQLTGDGNVDGGSYLPTQRGLENKGYSASIFCNICGPEGGQTLVEQTLEMLEELAD